MKGYITSEDRFLFPDTDVSAALPAEVRVRMPRNGRAGVEMLIPMQSAEAHLTVDTPDFTVEYYRLHKIPVEYNTASGTSDQVGEMVLMTPSAECPPYATRLAPFYVYDCLEPLSDGRIAGEDGLLAAYICLVPKEGTAAGEYAVTLSVEADGESARITLRARVYDVRVEEGGFSMIHWHSSRPASLARGADCEEGSPAYMNLLRRHARAMRRMHQNFFACYPDGRAVVSREPLVFDFSYMKPTLELFFSEGFTHVMTGGMLSVGYFPDGRPDSKTGDFKVKFDTSILADSAEGYAFLSAYMKAFSAFLKENGWLERAYFQVVDEPDVHCPDEDAMKRRRISYYMAANILRRYVPNARIIEAVKTTLFKSGVDVMVPLTESYQQNKEEFDAMIEAGDEVWGYTCCVPEGFWLNRFLDKELNQNRLLYWGFESCRMSGYLHWAWNQFGRGMDPFVATSCYNPTGLGTNFPCGDAFIVYPGPADNTPWISMRLEAQRKGMEDACLLRALREKDKAKHDALVASVFTDFLHYNPDPAALAEAEEALYLSMEG